MKKPTPNTYSIEEMILLDDCLKAEDVRGVEVFFYGPPSPYRLKASRNINTYRRIHTPTPEISIAATVGPTTASPGWQTPGVAVPTESTPGAYSLKLAQTLKCTYLKHAWGVYNTELYQMIFTKPLKIMPKFINHKVPTLKAIARWRLKLGR